ncbi:hypothetical protein RvY_06815 [Ramazzottius varieornatus]|uniref:Protein kinase domain-containing protein n=1 Tax=Ramazzottius varieornatus TaxID=947166 RepID=A0A1D1V2Q9_RAMVA|nr:hypothetical protein RvY_06815 [Ramazzottius varieornatus]
MDNHAQVSYTTPLTAEVTQRYTAQLTEQLDLSASGHNYKLIWTPTSLRWFVDDQAVFIVADVKKIPKIRMYMYFTLFCNPGVERDGNSSNVFHQLWIESISVRKLSNLAETEEVVKTSVWEGWKYGVLFGILGGVLFCLSIAGAVFLKKWRAKERLGWRSRDRLSFKNNSLKMRMENDYLHRTISVPLSAGIYVIPPENLTRSDIVLGKGEHGIVFKGIATGLYGKVGPTVVAVKTLFSTEDNTSADASFKKELDVLARCGHHLNIVNLLGVVTTGRPSLLIEYCQYGSLLSYLREHRPPFFFSHVSSEGQLLPLDKEKYEKEGNRLHQKLRNDTSDHALLSTKDLINFAYQLARGMEYLASRPIVHRDLAARNVLVDKGKIVKISDFGMARQEGEYVLQDGSIALPIRWMSPTAVLNKTFNQSTDVWSYGVLLWELFTLGELPYGDRKIGGNTEAFLQEIIDGLRLPKPELSPNDMHDLMRDCWVLGPDTPCPTFEELKNRLDSLISQEISEYYTSLDALYEKFNEEHERVHGSEQLSDQLLEEQNPIH